MREITADQMRQINGGDISCTIGIASLVGAVALGAMTGGLSMIIGCAIGVASWQDGCFN